MDTRIIPNFRYQLGEKEQGRSRRRVSTEMKELEKGYGKRLDEVR
jgi:hypothetical protein